MVVTRHQAPGVTLGKTVTIISSSPTVAGSSEAYFHSDTDSLLLSLYVTSVAGDIDVVLYTYTEDGKELEVIAFPTISAPSSELLIRKAAAIMSNMRLVVTHTDAVEYEVRARGISSGESSTKIIGSNTFEALVTVVTVTPAAILGASLEDRNGILLKNYSTTATIFINSDIATATVAAGYPITPGEVITLDITAGALIYASTNAGVGDLRIVQAGG